MIMSHRVYSKSHFSYKTQNLIKRLAEDLNLSCRQQKALLQSMADSKFLSERTKRNYHSQSTKKSENSAETKPLTRLRSKVSIEASGAYEREKYHPSPWKVSPQKDKTKLQNLMAFGTERDTSTMVTRQNLPEDRIPTLSEQFERVVEELSERKEFLRAMAELGQDKEVRPVIESQISQKIKELELLDKKILENSSRKKEN